MTGTIATAADGNYIVSVKDEGSFRRVVIVEECCGGWWVPRKRELCPLSEREAKSILSYVENVATPTYERVLRLITEGA